MSFFPPSFAKKAFTLIDVLVGVALMLIIFLGILGAYQLGLRVISQSQNKIMALAIANQELEKIRNLPYESVGVAGDFPDGVLQQKTTIIRNNREYEIQRRVDYVVDLADGIALPEDDCPNDYKRIEVKVSWLGKIPGEVYLSTDIAPKNLAQECAASGGILSVSVFDAYGVMVASPLIEIKDPATDQTLKTAVPNEGKHFFSLGASAYKVVVSKEGYSAERTYGVQEIATPEKPHSIVLEDQLTEISFSVDKLASFSVDTLSSWSQDYFSDTFVGNSKIAQISNLEVAGGEVNFVSPSLEGVGFLVSVEITPSDLLLWDEFSWQDAEPQDTDLKYQIYHLSGSDWFLVPDSDLPGNSVGFDDSSVDLSGLSIAAYSELKLKANFSRTDFNSSPTLYSWQLSWRTSENIPIPDVVFGLQGAKIIGLDSNDNPIYKYSTEHISDSGGNIAIPDLEWDAYTFSILPATGLDLIDTSPFPQPIGLSPDTNQPVILYLKAENSLLVTIQNRDTLESVFSASVRLHNSTLGYDTTQYTTEKGQTFFIPLTVAVYNLEVQAPGYSSASIVVSVSGDDAKTIKIEQIE